MADYLTDPAAIYARSFELVRRETSLEAIPPALHNVVLRLVHACAMPDIVSALHWVDGLVGDAVAALRDGAPVLADCQMTARGVTQRLLPANCEVICTLGNDGVSELATARGTTRSAAALDHWRPHLDGAVVAIGNAPTALFRLLEMLDEGEPRPAAILAFPVGFVGAAESKQALMQRPDSPPFITLSGRRGGSALAAAAVNALALEAQGTALA